MNWIMKVYSEAYSTALLVKPVATHTRHVNGRASRNCVRERARPQPKKR